MVERMSKYRLGDRVIVTGDPIYEGCEGVIFRKEAGFNWPIWLVAVSADGSPILSLYDDEMMPDPDDSAKLRSRITDLEDALLEIENYFGSTAYDTASTMRDIARNVLERK
jgi:hypothetical protein